MASIARLLDARHFVGGWTGEVILYLARRKDESYTVYALDARLDLVGRPANFATRAAAEETFAEFCWPVTCRHPGHWEERARTPEGRRLLEKATLQ